MLGLLERTVRHLRRGTLLRRVGERHAYRRQLRRGAEWAALTRDQAVITAEVEPGLRMQLHRDSVLARTLFCDPFELAERYFVRSFLRAGDIFVDVGANIGLFTLIAARVVGDSGTVYAFEPAQQSYQRLCDNVALNQLRNVTCLPLALSSRSEQLMITVPLDGWDAWSSFAIPTAGDTFGSEDVPCISWDRFADERGLTGRVALMKIDVEGWEREVLSGAAATLIRADAPVLQVEFTEAAAESAGSSCRQLYRTLEELGYRMYTFDHRRRTLQRDPLREHYPYLNLFAIKEVEPVLARLRRAHAA